ncbi:MAG: PIN domain-containing protein [Lentisphaeria bacterium]|nr:PIN domain-containing protein [Lentisphaeria bacterium]
MTVYLDTSVVLRVLLGQPRKISCWGRWDKAWSSRLWHAEALRTADRLRLTGEIDDPQVVRLRTDIDLVDQTLHVVTLTDAIWLRAEESFPTVVGTLDGIHLATALRLRHHSAIDLFLTHDQQLGLAARSLGFTVEGVD